MVYYKEYQKKYKQRPEVKQHNREYSKIYYATHKEQHKEWFKKNPDYMKNWLTKNRERMRIYKGKYMKRWRTEHPEKDRKNKQKYYQKHKEEVNNQRKHQLKKLGIELVNALGSKCQICSYNKNKCALDIHHIGKRTEPQSHNRCRSRKQLVEYIELWKQRKIMLLCANCHREIHHKDYEEL